MNKIKKTNASIFAVVWLVLIKLHSCTNNHCLTNKGKQFIFGFMPNAPGSPVTLRLFITTQAEKDVSITITTPLFDSLYQQNLSVQNGQVKEVTLSSALQVSSGVENKGIYVEADEDVSVYASSTRLQSKDDFLVLPNLVLGNEYYVTSWSDIKPSFMVVATHDFTKLNITLGRSSYPVILIGSTINPGESVSLVVRAFETIYFQTSNGDFTGTHIYGNASFAVFGGSVCANIGSSACDHMAEQMLPVDRWGKEFVTLSMPGCASKDWFKIVVAFDNTIVNISGMPALTLVQSGDFYSFTLEDFSLKGVFSDKPISLFMFSSGRCGYTYTGDPSMLMIPALSQYASNATFSTNSPDKINFENYVGIVIDNNYKDDLQLDGSALLITSWISVDGHQSLVYTEFTVSADVHSISHLNSSVKFMTISAGIQSSVSYCYLLGIDFISDNEICTGK